MTNVIIVVNGGRVESVYSRNKNVRIEVLDKDYNGNEYKEKKTERRLKQIEESKTYKDIL